VVCCSGNLWLPQLDFVCFVCLLLNGTSKLFRLLVPRIVKVELEMKQYHLWPGILVEACGQKSHLIKVI